MCQVWGLGFGVFRVLGLEKWVRVLGEGCGVQEWRLGEEVLILKLSEDRRRDSRFEFCYRVEGVNVRVSCLAP